MRHVTRGRATCLFVVLAALLSDSWAAVTITPSVTDTNFSGRFTVTASVPSPGGTASVDVYLDFNRNGTINTEDSLWQHYDVTDGPPAPPAEAALVADTDGAANGSVVIKFRVVGPDRPFAGRYVVQVKTSSTTQRATLRVDPPSAGQSVAGQVRANGTTPTPAVVFLTTPQGAEDVLLILTDLQGNYTMPIVTPGRYGLAAVATGYLSSADLTIVDIASGQRRTGVNLVLPAGSYRWQGQVIRSDTTQGVPYLSLVAGQQGSPVGGIIGQTESNGSFDLPITNGRWEVDLFEDYLAQRGFVWTPSESDRVLDIQGATVSGLVYTVIPTTAFATGRAEDVFTHASLTDAEVEAIPSGQTDSIASAFSLDTGRFALGLPAGDYTIEPWMEEESELHGSYLAPWVSTAVNLTAGGVQDAGVFGFLPSDQTLSVEILLYPNTPLAGAYLAVEGHDNATDQDYQSYGHLTNSSGIGQVPIRSNGTWSVRMDVDSAPPGYDPPVPHRTDILAQNSNRLFLYPTGYPYGPYRVYGGDTPPPGGPGILYPQDVGYEFLGEASRTSLFTGTHRYFVVVSYDGLARVDCVQGSNGAFLPASLTFSVADYGNLSGMPDGQYALLGEAAPGFPSPGAVLFDAGETLGGVTVYHPIPLPRQVSGGILQQVPVWPPYDLNGDEAVDIADVIRAPE